MPKTNRNKLVGIIHMQRSTLALSDDEYKGVLLSVAGKESCSDCTYTELNQVFRELNRIMKQVNKKPFYFKPHGNTMQDAVAARAKKVFGENWKSRVDGFLTRINKVSLAYCTQKELRAVMGFITQSEKQKGKGGK